MMKNYNQSVELDHNPNNSYISNHIQRILIIGGSESGKTNMLLNLTKHQEADIEKIHLQVKHPFK